MWYNQQLAPQRPLLSKNKHPIPAIIHKTGPRKYKNLESRLKRNFQKIKKDNPGYIIEYYDDNRCKKFIKDNMSASVLEAYNNLIPGAYKADLFRYCVLFVKGGIYGDLSQQYLVPLDQLVDRDYDRLVIARDVFDYRCLRNGVQISFMAAIPGLSIFKRAINNIVSNVKYKKYGRSCIDVTGPSLFRRCLDNSHIKYRLEIEQSHGCLRDIKSKRKVIITKMRNHDRLINKTKHSDYSVLWHKGKIYR